MQLKILEMYKRLSHYRKYFDGAFRVLSIKKHLRLFRSGKSNNGHNGISMSGLIDSDSHVENIPLVTGNNQ